MERQYVGVNGDDAHGGSPDDEVRVFNRGGLCHPIFRQVGFYQNLLRPWCDAYGGNSFAIRIFLALFRGHGALSPFLKV